MNFGKWISKVIEGDRPGAALVISGPQGSGKSLMTNSLLHEVGLSIYEASDRSDLVRPTWGNSDAVVFREGLDPESAIELVCNTEWAADDGEARSIVPTPLAVIVETFEPDLYEGRRFVHIKLGEDV